MREMICLAVLLATRGGLLVDSTRADAPPVAATYDVVKAGMSCRQVVNIMKCDYRVGRSPHFIISGVGGATAAIGIISMSTEDEYVVIIDVSDISHDCVAIFPAALWREDAAFVSPLDGKVYPTREACAGVHSEEEDKE